jgi:hypothetical protein
MSYIAKVYLNKMFRKQDCLTIEGDMLKILVRNVLNPIPLQKPPANIYEHVEIKGDGQLLVGKEKQQGLKVSWKGKIYTPENAKDVEGQVVNIGDEYIVYVPNPGWKVGETHELYVKIIQDRPIEIKVSLPVV